MSAVSKAEAAMAQDQYDVASIPVLEAAVAEQIASNTYSFETNLALLNLYQLKPEASKEAVVVQILAKALMSLPSSDFSLCLAVTSKHHHKSGAVAWLCTLSNHLETGDFKAFWTASSGGAFDVSAVAGFHDAVRGFVLGLVEATYQKVPLAALGELLQLEGAALDAAIGARGFSKGAADVVAVPLNAENQMKPEGAKETIDFRALAPVYEMTMGAC